MHDKGCKEQTDRRLASSYCRERLCFKMATPKSIFGDISDLSDDDEEMTELMNSCDPTNVPPYELALFMPHVYFIGLLQNIEELKASSEFSTVHVLLTDLIPTSKRLTQESESNIARDVLKFFWKAFNTEDEVTVELLDELRMALHCCLRPSRLHPREARRFRPMMASSSRRGLLLQPLAPPLNRQLRFLFRTNLMCYPRRLRSSTR